MLWVLTLLVIFAFPNEIRSASPDINVVIVGSGAAGIAAATRLYKHGIENITILEAENRIGGRINSVEFGDAYVDLGAQWCHGEVNNIVYGLVKNLNILRPDPIHQPKLYHSQYKLIDEEFSKQISEIYESFDIKEARGQNNSLGEFYLKKINETATRNWANQPDKLILANEFLPFFEKVVLCYQAALSWLDISADNSYEMCEGEMHLNWNGLGYKTILDVLMQKYPDSKNAVPIDDKIFLNKEVNEILWNNNENNTQKVVVNCLDGSKYVADHVILTPSVGVLKDRFETMFKPPLPTNKIDAIQAMGFGVVVKVFLQYTNKWWNTNDFGDLAFIWNEADLEKTARAFPDGPNKDGRSWITSIMTVGPIAHDPNVLLVWFTGEFVLDIETCSDETVLNGIMYTLHEFLGQDYPNITRPDNMIRNKWYTNPHFRGTYSYETQESRKGSVPAQVILSQPLSTGAAKDVLLFAGEATNLIHYSTVHGAIETGFREADRLIAIYK